MMISLIEVLLYLVCLEEVDGSGDIKFAGHEKLNSCRLGDEPSTVRLFPTTHLTQELLHSLDRHERERKWICKGEVGGE